MLWRYPEGIDGPGWFQANCRSRPPWLPVHEVTGRRGETLRYCVVEEPAALAWAANLGTIEFHPFLSAAIKPDEPTWLVFDLDPGPPATLIECAQVALVLRARLERLGLEPVVKTSGALGLHVFVGLASGHDFGATKRFSRDVARGLAEERPDLVVERSGRSERHGRVFIDWIQNDRNRQIAAPYTLRATAVPLGSTPLTWDEVERLADGTVPDTVRIGPRSVLERLARMGDPFRPALEGRGRLAPTDPAPAASVSGRGRARPA
jgi:bifunctional non-homologous end joining protein LigD